MITFWIFSVAMIIVSLIFLLRPFFLDMKKNEIERSTLNINITKERLAELENELALETITQAEYEQTREELEQALLFDIEQDQEEKAIKQVNTNTYNRYTRSSLLLSVPVLAVSFYFYLGQPDLINGAQKQSAASGHASGAKGKDLPSVEEMIEKLVAKLEKNPNNAEGWFMLARSYMSMNRYNEAVNALKKTDELVPNNPVIMLRYADALSMINGGKISGKPFELVKRAVALKPNDPTGLWLIGMGYGELGEYKKAISYWNLLLTILKDEKSINEVQNLIRQAKSKAGISLDAKDTVQTTAIKKAPTAASIKINVTIDKKLLNNVSPTDTLFIFAKALKGPPMPLAVVRKQVKDLPLQVTLDDSMAMIPNMKLSSFSKVKITARISKTGQPLLQKGDVHSKEKHISLPYSDLININIDSIAK